MKQSATKLRVGVLMGGRSIEAEVSFNSGRTICDHLDGARYNILPIFQSAQGELYLLPAKFLHRGKIADFAHKLEQQAQRLTWDQLPELIDFVYLALHGRYGEDGAVQGMLEVLGIPYLGSKVLGSACGMDKSRMRLLLAGAGIEVPKGFVVPAGQAVQIAEEVLLQQFVQHQLTFPCVVKPVAEGSSFGVQVVHSLEHLPVAVAAAATIDPARVQDVLLEEKIEGMEFVCVLLQDAHEKAAWRALPLTQVCTEQGTDFFDYEQKYMPGRATKITPAPLTDAASKEIVETCVRVARVMQCATIARIDGFYTVDGRVVVIDPNTITGMSPATFLFHQAAQVGMSHTDLINHLIEVELASYGMSWQGEHHMVGTNTDHKKRLRVAVLLGGDSNEREVSLESGRNVCYKLSPERYEVLPLFMSDRRELFLLSQELLIQNSTRQIAQLCTPDNKILWSALPGMCDFVFIALHGGCGENGSVQGLLEMLGLPYNGSGVFTSALCMDKALTNQFLASQGIAVPRHVVIDRYTWDNAGMQKEAWIEHWLLPQLSLPLIVKPHDDGCSVMVQAVHDVSSCARAIETLFACGKTKALVEEYIQGIELSCGVIGNEIPEALPPSLAVAKSGVLSIEEKFLPGAGENQTPAPLPSDATHLVQQTMQDVYRLIGARGYVRIDCFWQSAAQSSTGKQRVVVLEVNTLPALTPATCLFHQAAEVGMRPMELIDRIVQLGLQAHQGQPIALMEKIASETATL